MYFDPGTGSMIIQMLVAALAGVGVFFVTVKTNFIAFIKRKGKKHDKSNSSKR